MISISHLQKDFIVEDGDGKVSALNDLNIEVERGEFFVIVGASGSGKTTLLRSVAGLETPDSGSIKIDSRTVFSNKPPVWVSPQDRGFGMVFQSYAVWPHLSVYDNVSLPLREGSQKIPSGEVRGRVEEALAMVSLEEQIDRPSTLLSGGQQQRVALARAIAVNPQVLLMDEPLSNLDARLREEVRGKIRGLAKDLGATVLYVTHDQIEAMAIADKIAIMSFGKLLQFGSPTELYKKPNRAEVAEFFGTVNWLEGESQGDKVKTSLGEVTVGLPSSESSNVWLGIRPEHLLSGPENAQNKFSVELKESIFLGDQYAFESVNADIKLSGKSRNAPDVVDGKIEIAIDPGDIMVFEANHENNEFIRNSLLAS